MSKEQFLFRGYTILVAMIASSGFILSAPAFAGTIFLGLQIGLQAVIFLVLISLMVRVVRARKQKEA